MVSFTRCFIFFLTFASAVCVSSVMFPGAWKSQCVKQARVWVPLWPGSGQGPLQEHLAPLPGSGSREISPGHFCASPSLAEMWDPPKAKCGPPPGFSAPEEAVERSPNLCCSTLMSLCVLRFFFLLRCVAREKQMLGGAIFLLFH